MSSPRSLGLVFVHGGFHQPNCFDQAVSRLSSLGFSPIVAVRNPSVGTDPSVTVDDDARNIAAELGPHLAEGVQFVALSHSYGGTPLTIALKTLSVAHRKQQGLQGGVRAVVYVTSNMPPSKGASALSVFPPGLDIVDMADGLVTGNAKAKEAFYGPDMADDLADSFMAALLPQSQESLLGPASVGLDELEVPAYYVLCEKDQTIRAETQEQIIATIPTLKRVLRNPGGHCAFITQVDLFVSQVVEIAEEVEREGF